jgi:hypothetical protein
MPLILSATTSDERGKWGAIWAKNLPITKTMARSNSSHHKDNLHSSSAHLLLTQDRSSDREMSEQALCCSSAYSRVQLLLLTQDREMSDPQVLCEGSMYSRAQLLSDPQVLCEGSMSSCMYNRAHLLLTKDREMSDPQVLREGSNLHHICPDRQRQHQRDSSSCQQLRCNRLCSKKHPRAAAPSRRGDVALSHLRRPRDRRMRAGFVTKSKRRMRRMRRLIEQQLLLMHGMKIIDPPPTAAQTIATVQQNLIRRSSITRSIGWISNI